MASYSSAPCNKKFAKQLFKANSDQLPKDNKHAFGFDTSDNHYRLQGLGDVSKMGDAVFGQVAEEMMVAAPRWLAVRNVSDPQIEAEGTLKQQAMEAAQIYKAFGRWSSVCSASCAGR